MLSRLHSRKTVTESTGETQGFILNWGWTYDLMVWFFLPIMYGISEQKLRRMTAEMAQLQPGEAVLDVGCGTGMQAIVAKALVGPKGRVCGIDPAPRQLARARTKAARQGLPVDFQLGVIEQIPFPDQTFDVVLSTWMMHHLPDDLKRQGLLEIVRVLKPGGRLLVLDATDPSGPWKSDIKDLPALMQEVSFAHVEMLEPNLRGIGFVIGRTSKAG